MKLSIIMPAYNVQEYIGEAIDSILKQMNEDVELVVVDDGSTDSTGSIIRDKKIESELKGRRMICLTKPNGGLSDARNFGLAHASGDYVWFFDSDDVLRDDSLSQLLDILRNNFDLIHIRVRKTQTVEMTFARQAVQLQGKISSGSELLVELFDLQFPCYAVSYLVKRKLLLVHQFQFKSGMLYEDVLTTYLVFSWANTAYAVSDGEPYLYRSNDKSIVNTVTDLSITSRQLAFQNLTGFIESNPGYELSYKLPVSIIVFAEFDLFQFRGNMRRQYYREIMRSYRGVKDRLDMASRFKFNIILVSGRISILHAIWLRLRDLRGKLNGK